MRPLLIVPVLLLAGCGSKTRMPYLGRWKGEFAVEDFAKGENAPARRKANRLAAELQLYATRNRFVLQLDGAQQSVEIEGEWALRKKGGVELVTTRMRNDDRGGEEFRNPSLPYLSTQDLQAAFARPLILRPDGPRLRSLPVGLADLIGRLALTSDRGG